MKRLSILMALLVSLITGFFGCYLPDGADNSVPADPRLITNSGFETGDLTGWSIVNGTAFDSTSVSSSTTWWAEAIPYNQDGDYHLDGWLGGGESAVGTLKSSTFTLSGTGWITFKLGGMKNPAQCYISVKDAVTGAEVARYGNTAFADVNFPNPDEGLRLANMEQYRADLSPYVGLDLYIEVVDNATSDWGVVFADSFETYYETAPSEGLFADNMYVLNSGFETGTLGGWTAQGDAFTADGVTSDETWWAENIPFNRDGSYHFCSWMTVAAEPGTGSLTSSAFLLSGSGWISFKLGGMKNGDVTYVSVYDADTETEIARFGNSEFADINFPDPDAGMRLANMELYKADLSAYIGSRLYLQVVDNATADWGIVVCDSFNVLLDTEPDTGVNATDILP